MKPLATQKAEHERLAQQAAQAGQWATAATELAYAAQNTLTLAEQCEGAIAAAYLADAQQLADCAVKLREQARKSTVAASETAGDSGAEDGGRWQLTPPEKMSLADVVGLEEAKEVVRNALIDPNSDPDIFEKYRLSACKGILLYGPPGTGKTTFAKAVASEMGLPFIEVKCADLKDKYVGASEKNVRDVFAAARKHGRCILFFDECDRVMSQRGNEKISMVEEFLVQFNEKFVDREKGLQIFVIAGTNKPQAIDERLLRPGRLNPSVYVGMPEKAARRQMFVHALEGVPLAADVDPDHLAELTDGYGGADICASGGICYKAKIYAARRWLARRRASDSHDPAGDPAENITRADFERAIREVPPAVRYAAGIIAELDKYRRQMSGNSTENNHE